MTKEQFETIITPLMLLNGKECQFMRKTLIGNFEKWQAEQQLNTLLVSVAKHPLPRPIEAWKAANEMELSKYIEWHLEQERRGNER